MVYDEGLAQQIRDELSDRPGYSEKKMFGGLCFLVNGNMACGVTTNKVMLRIGKENYEEVMSKPHMTEMDFTGKPMRGMVYIDEEGSNDEDIVRKWVDYTYDYAFSLPPK